ncbi:S-layer homology domain-containing protein [Paenibacillus planticolens]|uniref:Family 16 glycosylhydrolase n=1 Tax=Paenibacillus planticolens TaxID=2654976 RepID=A0ABX1ZRJ0_9BACL|nr:S-layer homology domain-containing protein [Paenibacillus planticolens]NOV01670.1 family 16 glycosylhydrolase [Paenibacillus planticolens]
MIIRKTIFSLLSACTLLVSVAIPVAAADQPSLNTKTENTDVDHHWASVQLKKWMDQDLLSGYEDGTIRPDQAMTRAEFIATINRIFGFAAVNNASFSDVKRSDWYAADIAKASKAGYASGYPNQTFLPLALVTRQDASVMLQQVFHLPLTPDPLSLSFRDAADIQSYAASAVQSLAAAGYLTGYPDGTFEPERPLSRAEAVAIMDRMAPKMFTVPATYTGEQIHGNAVINTPGVTLTDMQIDGNLYLAEGIGSGDAVLKNVVVNGITYISGGGSHSIHMEGSRLNKAVLRNVDRSIRVVLDGDINEFTIESQAIVEISDHTRIGYLSVAASANGTTVIGDGIIEKLKTDVDMTVNGKEIKQGASMQVTGGKVKGNTPSAGGEEPTSPLGGGGASQPGGVTEPTQPGGVTEPTQPGGVTEPTQPGGVTEPTQPGGGTEPTQPGGVTEPTQPGGVTEPTQPGGGTEPVQPGGGTEPTQPGGGTEPTQPGGVTEPTQPGGVTEPTQPGGGTEPTEPGGSTQPPSNVDPNWTLVWDDEFNGDAIDTYKWNFVEGGGGYGNNELQYYTQRPENVRVENGSLVLQARPENYKGSSYTSAKLTTKGKGDWTYGRYEIRAKLPSGKGMWPAIWMMPSKSDFGGWPASGEIDIMELLGHEPNKIYGTIHYGNPYDHTGGNYTLENRAFSDDFHTYSIEWKPGQIQWFVDGILYSTKNDWYSRSTNQTADNPYPAPFDRDFYLQLNLAVGGNWPGNPDATTDWTVPKQMAVDYVRVYTYNGQYPDPGPRPGKNLAAGWSWVRENGANWYVDGNPKQMNITTQDGSFTNTQTSLPGNMLVRDPGTTDFAFSAKVKFNASANFEYAGLIVYQDDKNYISLGRCFSGANQIRFTKGQAGTATDKNYTDSVFPQEIYLKIEKTSNNMYNGYYSQDGVTWIKTTDSFSLPLTNPRIGLFTRKLGPAAKSAVFSDFSLNGEAVSY